jgi:propionyl-CoA carboxylase beta chain
MSIQELLTELNSRNAMAETGGGEARIACQHQKGKLTARERLQILLDQDSFAELDKFVVSQTVDYGKDGPVAGDGVVTGHGTIEGRPVYVFAQDCTVYGGSLSAATAAKVCKVMDMALKMGAPVIGLYDSGGARLQAAIESLAGYGDIFLRNTTASGVIPQISAIMGPCPGGAALGPAISDFIFMVRNTSHLFMSGPEVIKTVTGEEVSREELGGAATHSEITGLAHFACMDDEECLLAIRELFTFFPRNNEEDPPQRTVSEAADRLEPALRTIVAGHPEDSYDMKEVLQAVVDDGNLLEVQEGFAKNLIIGFARLNGRSVGMVANQPNHLAGVIDGDAAIKGARFVRFCDAFNIPLIVFEDIPGFLPGVQQEQAGLIRHGAKFLYAMAEATVPKLTVITRKAYGSAYCIMNSRHIRADYCFAYPTAEIALVGPEGAVDILHHREIAAASDPEAARRELVADYRRRFANPYPAAERGYVDEVIDPAQTRPKLIRALEMAKNKRDLNLPRKHGNIPL